MTESTHESELDRIREAYRARDAGSSASGYSWQAPGYRFYVQQLEWDVLTALDRAQAPLRGGRVLEVGCGSGYFLHRLVEYGASHAAGIDLMPDRIEQARARYPSLELVAGDAGAMPWEDASFDVVTQFTCLSSVLDPEVRARIARDMWRVLRPGGVILSYDMRTTPAAIRALGRLRGGAGGGGTPTRPVDLDELRGLFPHGELHSRVVTLNLDLANLAIRTRALAYLAERLPALRTHLLVTVRRSP
jgi:SAM-dependent methyltransferase